MSEGLELLIDSIGIMLTDVCTAFLALGFPPVCSKRPCPRCLFNKDYRMKSICENVSETSIDLVGGPFAVIESDPGLSFSALPTGS